MNTEKIDTLNGSEYGCPQFEAFLKMRFREKDIATLQAWAGQVVLGENFGQKILVLVGGPAGGKTSLLRVFRGLLGSFLAVSFYPGLLGNRFEISKFLSATLLIGEDLRPDVFKVSGTSRLKELISGDPVRVNRKWRDPVEVMGRFNVVLSMNTEPTFSKGEEEAWSRRLVVLRMKPDEHLSLDHQLSAKLLVEESAGIWRWMLAGMGEARGAVR